jgi:dephospho-CoA kinase
MNAAKRLIIGITGTLGAGKGAVVDYLTSQHHFLHFSVRSYLTEIIVEREMPVNRDSMVIVANELRAANSPSYLAEQLLSQAVETLSSAADSASSATSGGAIIESIRTVGEVEALRSSGHSFVLLAVDADPKLRYDRVVLRKSATDQVSFEKFVSDEKREMNNNEPHKQNLKECIQRSDYTLTNEGTLEDLHLQVDQMLREKGILSLEQVKGGL